ncbi:hypothetical protein [Micromonospora sp. KC213]|uniref:hypothetical protein n=1 Tax=Micromonospora sp. KC213 TaxID=2530378 RepID=UPI001049EB50|nr:hypothetical protein [Micromonospora sp. KC213]TDC43820.1 hypothetical protein E1166_02155 [Micromonospora sp. KC213]
MSDEIIQKLRQLHQYTADLRSLVEQLQPRLPQATTAATDPSGVVHISVDANGIPELIHVEVGWERRVDPQHLGACVLSAYQEAASKVMQSLAEGLNVDDWRSGTEDVAARSQRPSAAGPPLPQVPVYGRPRDPLALAEEAMKALQVARARAVTSATAHVGQADGQRVSITLSASGLQGCSIEPAWAEQQSAASINDALDQALRSARSSLDDANSRGGTETQVLDTLAGEALATLVSITETTERRKGY